MAHTASPPSSAIPRPQQWGLWLVALLALALRLFRLGHQSLWVDEIDTWFASAPTGPLTFADLLVDRHGPLVSLLLHGWMRAFGDSEFSLRLPFAIAGALVVPAVAGLARRVAGERAALPAAVIVALSPFAVWYGQEARNYSFVFLWAALALNAALDYRAHGRARDLTALAAWSLLGILSNLNGALLVPVTFGALALAPPAGRARLAPLAVTLGAMALVLAPWALRYFHVFEFGRLMPGRDVLPGETPLRGLPNFSWPAVPYTFYAFSVGYSLGPTLRAMHVHPGLAALRPYAAWFLVVGVVFGTLAVRGLASLRARRFESALLVAAFVVPAVVVAYFAAQNFKTFHPRYLGVALPGWWAALAAGWVACGRGARIALGGAVLALCGIALCHHYADPAYGKDDFRAAVAYLGAHVAPGDSLVVTGNYAPMLYYWRVREPFDRAPRPSVYWLGYAQDARMEAKFEPHLDRTGGATWLVVSRPEDLDRPGRFVAWLKARFRPEVREFPGVRVYRIPPQVPLR